jgi:hypothetical protein
VKNSEDYIGFFVIVYFRQVVKFLLKRSYFREVACLQPAVITCVVSTLPHTAISVLSRSAYSAN